MDSVASATRDLSQLSVSKNPTPSRKFEPIDFSELQYGSVSFTTSRTKWGGFGGNVAPHRHVIGIDGNKFTVDGGPERDADEPKNAKFLECIKNYEIPEEFAEDGVHTILIFSLLEGASLFLSCRLLLSLSRKNFLRCITSSSLWCTEENLKLMSFEPKI